MRTDQNLQICLKVPDFECVMLCGLLLTFGKSVSAEAVLRSLVSILWFGYCGNSQVHGRCTY